MSESVILHPEQFVTPVVSNAFRHKLESQGQGYLANNDPNAVMPMSIVIRTKNDENNLEALFYDIEDQVGRGDTQVIVVDTESTDRTRQIAKSFGAQIVGITQKEFNYPLAINKGFKAVEHELALSIVGHVLLATSVAVAAGANHFNDDTVGGVYVPPLPAANASRTEKFLSLIGNGPSLKPARLTKAGIGIMGATNAIFRKDLWEEFGGFDLAFAGGGEDGDMARKIVEAGFVLDREPLVGVHHTHGLGPIDTARQWKHWASLGKPTPFSTEEISKRRPDLDL